MKTSGSDNPTAFQKRNFQALRAATQKNWSTLKKKKKKALAAMQNLCFPPCGSESDYPNTVNTHLWRTPLTS